MSSKKKCAKDVAYLLSDAMKKAVFAEPLNYDFDTMVRFIAQGVINIDEPGQATIERGSRIHRAMSDFCNLMRRLDTNPKAKEALLAALTNPDVSKLQDALDVANLNAAYDDGWNDALASVGMRGQK